MPPEITCEVNGETIILNDGVVLSKLISDQGYQGKGFATAVNGEFVPRSRYAETPVQPGDKIDIVAPVTGG